MKDIIKIQGYKCPYCSFTNTNENDMIIHVNHCIKNDEYVQKCITCSYLETNWLTRKLYDNKSICCYSSTTCPYINHDESDINVKIIEHNNYVNMYSAKDRPPFGLS